MRTNSIFDCLALCDELVDVLVDAAQTLFELVGVGERDAESVGDVEAVAVADEHALLVEQVVAEFLGGHIEIVVNEICCTVRVSVLVEIRIFLDPLVDDDLVGVHNPAGALENLVDVLKRDGEDPFVKHAAADGVVGAPVEEPLARLGIMADDPTDATSGSFSPTSAVPLILPEPRSSSVDSVSGISMLSLPAASACCSESSLTNSVSMNSEEKSSGGGIVFFLGIKYPPFSS